MILTTCFPSMLDMTLSEFNSGAIGRIPMNAVQFTPWVSFTKPTDMALSLWGTKALCSVNIDSMLLFYFPFN